MQFNDSGEICVTYFFLIVKHKNLYHDVNVFRSLQFCHRSSRVQSRFSGDGRQRDTIIRNYTEQWRLFQSFSEKY